MTEIQFNEIKKRLSKWRKERLLNYKNQRYSYNGNFSEEISEYFRFKSDYDKVDAIIDICIFTFNSYNVPYSVFQDRFKVLDEYNSTVLALPSIYFRFGQILRCQIEKDYECIHGSVSELLGICIKYIEYLGYDFYKCILETIKELNSRIQCETQKKIWIDAKELAQDEKIEFSEALNKLYSKDDCDIPNKNIIYSTKFLKEKGAYTKEEIYDLCNSKILSNFYVVVNNNNTKYLICDTETDEILDSYIKWYKADYESCRIK